MVSWPLKNVNNILTIICVCIMVGLVKSPKIVKKQLCPLPRQGPMQLKLWKKTKKLLPKANPPSGLHTHQELRYGLLCSYGGYSALRFHSVLPLWFDPLIMSYQRTIFSKSSHTWLGTVIIKERGRWWAYYAPTLWKPIYLLLQEQHNLPRLWD